MKMNFEKDFIDNLGITSIENFYGTEIIYDTNGIKIYSIKNCFVNFDGIIFNSKGQALAPTLYLLTGKRNYRLDTTNKQKIKIFYKDIINGNAAVHYYGAANNNYYHFHHDFLNKGALFHNQGFFEIHKVLTHDFGSKDYNRGFKEEINLAINMNLNETRHENEYTLYRCTELIYMMPLRSDSFYNPHGIESLRLKLSNGFLSEIKNNNIYRKIYLSRINQKRRNIVNEEDIHNIVLEKGFEIFYPEKLSVKEQAILFRSASHVIAPSGAAITNLIYSNPQTKFLEIINGPENDGPQNFWRHYCDALGIFHSKVHCEKIPEDLEKRYQDSKYTLNTDHLEDKIRYFM